MLRYKLESIIYILVQIYFLKLSKDSRNLVLGNITHQSKIFFFVTVYLRLINVCPRAVSCNWPIRIMSGENLLSAQQVWDISIVLLMIHDIQ